MNRERLSSEFRLVAACCRWPQDAKRDAAIGAFAKAQVDWKLVLALAARHRVEGFVHRALRESKVITPEPANAALAARATTIAAEGLRQVVQSVRLMAALDAEGIRYTFVKGITLARLIYGTLGVKQAWDIDVLVPPDQASAAAAKLAALGYVRALPGPEIPDDAFDEWNRLCKESLWSAPDGGSTVELHTGLVDNPLLLDGVSAHSPQRKVEVAPGVTMPTLLDDALFTYLVIHGATHGWSRLKWLVDVAAMAAAQPPGGIEALYRAASALGGGRSAGQALLLSAELLALELPPALRAEIETDRKTGWLASLAVRAMTGRGARELDDTLLGTAPIHISHFIMARGWRYKFSEARRKMSNPEDALLSPLPRHLRPLSPLLAIPRWIQRRYRLSRT